MTPEQINSENAKATKLGIIRSTPSSRYEPINLVAGLLAHHAPVDFTHRNKAIALVDGLNLHGLLTEYCT
jgi:hypothetical protein